MAIDARLSGCGSAGAASGLQMGLRVRVKWLEVVVGTWPAESKRMTALGSTKGRTGEGGTEVCRRGMTSRFGVGSGSRVERSWSTLRLGARGETAGALGLQLESTVGAADWREKCLELSGVQKLGGAEFLALSKGEEIRVVAGRSVRGIISDETCMVSRLPPEFRRAASRRAERRRRWVECLRGGAESAVVGVEGSRCLRSIVVERGLAGDMALRPLTREVGSGWDIVGGDLPNKRAYSKLFKFIYTTHMTSVLVRRLHNDVLIPAVGYGTWQLPNDDSTVDSALGALTNGYHHIDTADCYEVQPALGKALAKWTAPQRKSQPNVQAFAPFEAVSVETFRQNFAIPHNDSPDRDIFLTGKIFTPDFKSEEAMRESVERFKSQMGRDADLMLLHWPGHPRVSWYEKMPLPENHRFICWKVMEKLYAEKRVRAIGVSNYMRKHLEPLVADVLDRQAKGDKLATLPMINQIEFSPYMQPDADLLQFMDQHKIARTSYSTLGSTADPAVEPAAKKPEVIEIAKAHNKLAHQVILRWALQHGCCVIPRTSKVPHALENKDILDFSLTQEEMNKIDKLHCGRRVCPDPNEIA